MTRKNQKHSLIHLDEKRKTLRKNLTEAETVLWDYIKDEQIKGFKFRRQHSIENFIVDFYCATSKLIIELDGQDHFTEEGKEKDKIRDEILSELGFLVIRFENKEVIENPKALLKTINTILEMQKI